MVRVKLFCTHFSIYSPLPTSESLLCYFAAYLARDGLAPASIRLYLSAVRHTQVLMGYPEPRAESTLPRLKLVLNGIARSKRASSRSHGVQPSAKPRLPITSDILWQLYHVLATGGQPDYATTLLWAVCSICFFGFFRVGELLPQSSSTAVNGAQHVFLWGDVSVDSTSDPRVLKNHLRVSKCDQVGRGVDVFVGRCQGNELCPVAACMAYAVRRGSSPGPFFCNANGSPFSKAQFVSGVRRTLTFAGLDASKYSGHSFRIGAATSAGIEDSVIKALGRWSSAAFLLYIRTPRQHLAQVTASIASTLR